jgi:hemolysin activation/secretion protein
VRREVGIIFAVMVGGVSVAQAQTALDQSNTVIIQRDTKPQVEAPAPSTISVESESGDTPQPQAAPSTGLFIGAIRVSGARAVPIEAFSAAIEPFIGRSLTNADMAMASRAVADVARARGFKFASAYVAPQSLSLGVLTITLDEGAIASVRIEGSKNRQIRRILSALEGAAMPYAEVERRLLLVADLPGITLGKVRFLREGTRGVLLVAVSEDRVSGRAGFDSLGSRSSGPVRAIVSASVANLAVPGDAVTVQAAATPVEPGELAFARLSYALPVDADGTVVSGSFAYGRSEPGGVLKQFDSVGDSVSYELTLRRQLLRSRSSNLYIAASLEHVASRQSLFGRRARDTRIDSFTLSLGGNRTLWGGRLRSEISITQGLGGTKRGDPLASRRDAGSGFTKLNLDADWTGKLADSVSLRLATLVQISADPLFSEQEIGLGGARFGRGYSFSERSGDSGALGLAELRTDLRRITPWLEWAQPYVFIDGGRVTNIDGGFGGGSLLSGGGGVRTRFGGIDFGVESAYPLTSERFDSGDHSPRFNLQLSTRF